MKNIYTSKRDADAKAFSTKDTRDIYVLKTKIAHFEDKIRVAELDKQKLKKLEKEKIGKIEEEKTSIEESIDNVINEINKKKEKIYNIQKQNVDTFRTALGKLTEEYEQLEDKLGGFNEELTKLKNEGQKLKAEYDEANNQYAKLKENAEKRIADLNMLKEKYPEEFKYFQEKTKLLNKINELKQENKNIDKERKNLEKNISEDSKVRMTLNTTNQKITSEKDRNSSKIEELKSGIALEQLESDLVGPILKR